MEVRKSFLLRMDAAQGLIMIDGSWGGDCAGMSSEAEDLRYRFRTGVERVFSHLHDAHGGKTVRVRGNEKVFLHLMFGVLVIAAEQILKLLA